MPFSQKVKERMFTRCCRICCLCRKRCGTNIEAAHIIAEAAGGPNDEDNGIPLCLDCHQEIGGYDVQHPRGNKFTAAELRQRRDATYAWVESNEVSAGEMRLEEVQIRGGEGSVGAGGDAKIKGAPGQNVTVIGGSIIGGKGGAGGGKGGDAGIEGGAGQT
jgi:hypothetical protein